VNTLLSPLRLAAVSAADLGRRQRLAVALAVAAVLGLALAVAVGPSGLSWRALQADLAGDQAALILGQIRLPRALGALLVGALLGLAGAVAQGLFRNPLADPFLLGSAAGASLGVVLALATGASLGLAAGSVLEGATQAMHRVGLVGAAFGGALAGVGLTLMLARDAQQTTRLLLAGVVVGMVLGAAGDLVVTLSPEAMRGRQVFMLGSTAWLGWGAVAVLAAGLALVLPPALALARALDALTLGEDGATSLGLPVARLRLALVALMALATALAVSQAGLVAFVGLVSPHLVRRFAPAGHGYTLAASAATGGVLLLGADVAARAVIAPQELPVGVLTALIGGGYLLWLLHRRTR
jgi:iron complex transport system permease protein